VFVAGFIDIIVGREVTGGRWSLNVANIILSIIQGAAVGSVAGAIAKKRGVLISAIAVFLPNFAFSLLEVIKNRDMSDYVAITYDTKPALWAWIALIPAMVCGHVFSKAARQHELLSSATIVYVLFFNVAAAAFHLYTTYVAYYFVGGMGAFITFATPLLSEIYWFISIWHSTGMFLNGFTMRILACLIVFIVAGAVLGIIGLIDNRAKNKVA
jgi:hypothetical protein